MKKLSMLLIMFLCMCAPAYSQYYGGLDDGKRVDADEVIYDNTSSGLLAEDVQDAIDEVYDSIGGGSSNVFEEVSGIIQPLTQSSNLSIGGNVYVGGSIGIGKTTPTAPLDVVGQANVSGAVIAGASVRGTYYANSNANDTRLVAFTGKGMTFDYNDGASTAAYINSSGNIGIGTTAPDAALDVAGDVSVDGYLTASGIAVPCDNVFTVAPQCAEYTTIQDALDAATTGSLIVVYPGTYTDDTINFTASRQSVIGWGKGNNVIVSNSSQIVEAADYIGCRVQSLRINFTPTTAINGIEVNDGSIIVENCRLALTTSSDIAGATQPNLLATTGTGTLTTKFGEFSYEHTGDTTNGIKTMFSVSNGSTMNVLRTCLINLTNSGTAAASTLIIDSGSAEFNIEQSCDMRVTDIDANIVAGLGYIGGSGDNDISYNTITITGGGSNACYAIYNGGTGTIRSSHNKALVTGGLTNYAAFVGVNATLNGHMDDIRAADGNSGTGTINIVSSLDDGEFTATGDVFISGDVAISNLLSTSVVDDKAYYKGVELGTGGSGSPGGNDTEIQFNDGGSFGGASNLTTSDGITVNYKGNELVTSQLIEVDITYGGLKLNEDGGDGNFLTQDGSNNISLKE